MIEIIPSSLDYNHEEYDSCGNTTIAILKIDTIKIPLCQNCVKELTEEMGKFNSTTFCHECKHFIMSDSGWHYGGSCKLKAEKGEKTVTEEDAGYIYCVECMDTCKDAVATK